MVVYILKIMQNHHKNIENIDCSHDFDQKANRTIFGHLIVNWKKKKSRFLTTKILEMPCNGMYWYSDILIFTCSEITIHSNWKSLSCRCTPDAQHNKRLKSFCCCVQHIFIFHCQLPNIRHLTTSQLLYCLFGSWKKFWMQWMNMVATF